MLKSERSSPSITTPIVTVDRITEAHRALMPSVTLPDPGFIAAVYRDGRLDVIPTLIADDPQLISWLHTGAQQAAERQGLVHDFGCPWCHVNNCVERYGQHDRWYRSSETTWREMAA